MKFGFFLLAIIAIILISGCGGDKATMNTATEVESSATNKETASWAEIKDQVDPYKSKYEELRKKIGNIVDSAKSSQQLPDNNKVMALESQCYDLWRNQIEAIIPKARNFHPLVPDLQSAFTKLDEALTVFNDEKRDLKNKILVASDELEMADNFYYSKFLGKYNELNK